ncbi:GntR family transcriptional regulator [Roseobacter weihaiensis]|uniref:GntR family transcriptional regulator n=1 Tax=Roseobacter weihaiensis TaxID=2763262 RepID=UPI001D0AFAF3|nr:GntR family transcriptional regulator [Roseobacter sp. H9]
MDAIVTPTLPEGAKAQRVYLSLRDQITEGRLADGESLPGEQKLAVSFGVSRVTVRRALDALSQSGLIERRAGSGTTVRRSRQAGRRAAMDFNTLMPQLVEMGQSTTAQLLSFSYDHAPDVVAASIGLDRAEKVQIAVRVRLADGVPFSHLTTYVPARIAQNYSEHDLATTPLFKLLERSGVQIKEAHQSVSATLAAPDVAEALGVAVGSALLSLKRVVRDEQGNGVEYLAALYRPDMFRLEMPLARVGEGRARHWEPAIGQAGAAG